MPPKNDPNKMAIGIDHPFFSHDFIWSLSPTADDIVDGCEILHDLGCSKTSKSWDVDHLLPGSGFRNHPPYPLVMTNIATENHHFQWENPLSTVIFHTVMSVY